MQKAADAISHDTSPIVVKFLLTIGESTVDIFTAWITKFAGLCLAIMGVYKGAKIATNKINKIYTKIDNWFDSINDADTKINLALESLEKTAIRMKVLQMRNSTPAFESDADGNCTMANLALCELFCTNEVNMLGHGWLSKIGRDSEEQQKVLNNWEKAIKDDIPYKDTYYVEQGDGSFKHCNVSAIYGKNIAGEIIMISGTVKEIE